MDLTSEGLADPQVCTWWPDLTGNVVRRYDCPQDHCGVVIVLSPDPNKPTPDLT